MKRRRIRHNFVDFIPSQRKEGVIYVSIRYATAVHNCCCGCGNKVVTPISPTDWTLTFNGVSISLSPSVGNCAFPCQSHYWIRNNRVIWSSKCSKEQVKRSRELDALNKDAYFRTTEKEPPKGTR